LPTVYLATVAYSGFSVS